MLTFYRNTKCPFVGNSKLKEASTQLQSNVSLGEIVLVDK